MNDAVVAGPGVQSSQAPTPPVVARIEGHDLRDALSAGWRDFRTAPQFGLFFGLFYAAGGWVFTWLLALSGFFYLAYPLAAGFAIIAPFVAAGIYEVSRRIEAGQPVGWGEVFGAMRGAGKRDLGWMALVTGFAFFIWMDIAFFLYAMFFGLSAPDPWALFVQIATTGDGLLFFGIGTIAGACIAFFVFSITVVSFPILLDRDVDFVTAMITSVRVVRRNLRPMIGWALFIALLVFISLITAFAGLVVVLPLLGHATWHVYRRAILPDA